MHFIQLAKLRIIFRISKNNFLGYWLLVTGYWLRVTGYGSLAIVPQPSLKSLFDVE